MITREISKKKQRKQRNDYDSWVYDGDLHDATKKFTETQSDGIYCLG